MTEKEIAKKVWDVIDARIAQIRKRQSESELQGVIEEYAVEIEALCTLSNRIEKILPRPKIKVKKTEKRWVVFVWDSHAKKIKIVAVFSKKGEAMEYYGSGRHILQEIELSTEVEE